MLSIGQLEKMSIDSSLFFNLNTDDGLLLDEQLLLSSEEYFQSEKLEHSAKATDTSHLPFKGSSDMLGFNFTLESEGASNADSLSINDISSYHLPHILHLTRSDQAGSLNQPSRTSSFHEGSFNSMLLLSYPNPTSISKENIKSDLSLHSQDSTFPSFVFPDSDSAMTPSPLSTPTSYLVTPLYEDSLVIDPTSICRPCDLLEFDDSLAKSLSPSIFSEKTEVPSPRTISKRPSLEQSSDSLFNNKRRNYMKDNERTLAEFNMGNQSLFDDLFRDLETDERECCQMSEITESNEINDIISGFLDESSEGTLEKDDIDSDYTPSSSRRSSISSLGSEKVIESPFVGKKVDDEHVQDTTSTSNKQRKSPRKTSRKRSIVENIETQEPNERDQDRHITVYSCDFPSCGKTFSRLYNLKSHYRTHTDDRPYACDKCDQTFSRNHDLKRHYKIHSGVKPFSCEHCGKKFSRMDALGRHRAKRPQCRE